MWFSTKNSELAPKIVRFIEQFKIFLAPIDEDKRVRERIESEIAKSLNVQDGFVSGFQDKDVRYRPRTVDGQQVRVMMTFPK